MEEAALLSTCNRTELYCVIERDGEAAILDWLSRFHALSVEQLSAAAYHYLDGDAARHLMRVAVGLDSMVLGEPQILGQLKDAYQAARSHRGWAVSSSGYSSTPSRLPSRCAPRLASARIRCRWPMPR